MTKTRMERTRTRKHSLRGIAHCTHPHTQAWNRTRHEVHNPPAVHTGLHQQLQAAHLSVRGSQVGSGSSGGIREQTVVGIQLNERVDALPNTRHRNGTPAQDTAPTYTISHTHVRYARWSTGGMFTRG